MAAQFLGLDDESSSDVSRIDDTIIWKIERPYAILGKRCNRAGRSSCKNDFPNLPGIASTSFARKQHLLTVKRNRWIGRCGEIRNQRMPPAFIPHQHLGSGWEPVRTMKPSHRFKDFRDRVQKRSDRGC